MRCVCRKYGHSIGGVRTPFPQTTEFSVAVNDMVIELNGFVYAGDKLTAYCDLIKWMRENPGKANFLLTYEGPDA